MAVAIKEPAIARSLWRMVPLSMFPDDWDAYFFSHWNRSPQNGTKDSLLPPISMMS
jgi:hypothetical protein